MNRWNYGIIFSFLLSSITYSCPTCIGHIEDNSPPFFSDELYMDALESDENPLSDVSSQNIHDKTTQSH